VDDWLMVSEIDEEAQVEFPNAKTAAKIRQSPLYKALE
jgi:hypothetical protein